MPKKFIEVESSIESEEEIELDEDIPEPIKISKKTGKPIKPLSEKQILNLKLGRERGLVMKNLIKENKDITKTTAYIKEFKDKKNSKIKENNKILNDNFDQAIKFTEPVRKSIKKKKKKYIEVECSDSEESESDGIVINKEEIIVPSKIIEDPFSIERLLKQKLYNQRVDEITKFMLNKNK